MKKVLITGGDGVLASYAKKRFADYTIFAPNRQEMDITDNKQIESYFLQAKPDVVLHLAAKINVDECEKYPDDAYKVNSEGTKHIALACLKYGALMIYVSTAAVFDGTKNAFNEGDKKNPLSIYGKSKSLGEEYIKELLTEYIIFRAAWLIGGGPKEKKFISYIISNLKEGKEIKAVNDKYGSITYAKELADYMHLFIQKKKFGIYHIASNGAASRYDIAIYLKKLLKSSATISPVPSSFFSTSFFAPRPDKEIIISKYINPLYTWKETIKTYFSTELQ